MPLKDRRKYSEENWTYRTSDYTSELLLSNDRKYLFKCKFQLGNYKADNDNLHGRL